MKMVKSLLLVSAAGLVAVSGAQAADLPVKAKPVEYVKVCSLYGAGFYYVPGTDICLKIGAYFRCQNTATASATSISTDLDASAPAVSDPAHRHDYAAARPRVHLPGYPSADCVRHSPYLHVHGLRRMTRRRQRQSHGQRPASTSTAAFIQLAGLHVGQGDVVLRLLLDRRRSRTTPASVTRATPVTRG